jgi:hypothetical protein
MSLPSRDMGRTGYVCLLPLLPPRRASLIAADFSNVLSKSQIEEMASVDELEVVKEVQVRCCVSSPSQLLRYRCQARFMLCLMFEHLAETRIRI